MDAQHDLGRLTRALERDRIEADQVVEIPDALARRPKTTEEIRHRVPVEGLCHPMPDLAEETPALFRDAAEREAEKGCEVVSARARITQRLQVGGLLFVVVVGHRDEECVAESDTLEHQCFEGASGPAVAVEEAVHRCEVVVQRQRLDERIVLEEDAAGGLDEPSERLGARSAAIHATVSRRSEGDVLIGSAELSRRAVVVVAAGDEFAMDLPDQGLVDRAIAR